MSLMLQDLVVAVLVAGCAVFCVWRLMPVRLRLTTLDAVEPVLGRVARGPLGRLRAKSLAQLAGGCSACTGGAASHLRVVKR
jgi:hypothetical protein